MQIFYILYYNYNNLELSGLYSIGCSFKRNSLTVWEKRLFADCVDLDKTIDITLMSAY